MRPCVSVIVPVYNVEPYIARCLDSIIGQTLNDMEIICIDDHSTDGSLSILKQYAAQDSRVKILENSVNEGLSVSRNRGIDAAHGEYISFIDADDWIDEDGIRVVYEAGHRSGADIVFFDFKMEYGDQESKLFFKNVSITRNGIYNRVFTGKELFDRFAEDGGHPVMSCIAIYNKTYLDENKLRFFPHIQNEDNLFYFISILQTKSAIYIHSSHYHYIRRTGALTFKPNRVTRLKSLFIIYIECIGFLEKNEGFQSSEHILQYVCDIRRIMKKAISGMSWEELNKISFQTSEYNTKFRVLCCELENGFIRAASKKFMDRIKNAQSILIYGSGEYGRETVKWLINHGIQKFDVAVSDNADRGYLAGNQVRGISEYIPMRDKYLVLVAVGVRFRKEIVKTLKNLGFEYVCMRPI